MASKGSGWEGTALAFAMIFTVLMGVAYVLGISYGITIPWLAILVVSLLVAAALRLLRHRRA
ncbi:MAG: hypothetical protein DIU80_004190 [Chloroflexota bacterium]